jgi:hypothetical protein
MMTDGDVSAPDRPDDPAASVEGNIAGQAAIVELVNAQRAVKRRSLLARVFGMSPLNHETHALYRGVVGEIEVGEALDRLGAEWVALHALPVDVGAADIDHLVVGPAGVYIISTKNHSGLNVWASQRTFMAGGVRYPHVRNMEYEMGRAERMLTSAAGSPVEVSGVLAVVAAKSLVVRERHRDVAVVAANQLVSWLQRGKRVLTAAEVSHIATAASLASTWFQSGDVQQPHSVRQQFEKLRSEVQRAWRIQLAWAIGLSVLVLGTFGAVTYSILITAIDSFGY